MMLERSGRPNEAVTQKHHSGVMAKRIAL
ncbi:hypothetical protein CEXT_794711, partial [Caerostris extrusa]